MKQNPLHTGDIDNLIKDAASAIPVEYDPSSWNRLAEQLDKVKSAKGKNGSGGLFSHKLLLGLILVSLSSFVCIPGDTQMVNKSNETKANSGLEIKKSEESEINAESKLEPKSEEFKSVEPDLNTTQTQSLNQPEKVSLEPVKPSVIADTATNVSDTTDLFIFW